MTEQIALPAPHPRHFDLAVAACTLAFHMWEFQRIDRMTIMAESAAIRCCAKSSGTGRGSAGGCGEPWTRRRTSTNRAGIRQHRQILQNEPNGEKPNVFNISTVTKPAGNCTQ